MNKFNETEIKSTVKHIKFNESPTKYSSNQQPFSPNKLNNTYNYPNQSNTNNTKYENNTPFSPNNSNNMNMNMNNLNININDYSKKAVEIIDYLKESQAKELNDFNKNDLPNPNDNNFSSTNKLNEMLILTNLVFFKGSDLFQEIKKLEDNTKTLKEINEEQAKELAEREKHEEEYRTISLNLNASNDMVKRQKDYITELELEKRELSNTVTEYTNREINYKAEISNLHEKSLLVDKLVQEIKDKEAVILFKGNFIKEIEDSKKQTEEQITLINKFLTTLQDEVKEYRTKLTKTEDELTIITSNFKCLNIKNNENEKEINNLIPIVHDLKGENNHLKVENEGLKTEYKLSNSRISEKESEIKTLNSLIENLEEEVDTYKKFYQEKVNELSRRNSYSENLDLELKYQKKSLEEKKYIITDLEGKLAKKYEEDLEMENALQVLEQKLVNIDADEKAYKKQIRKLEDTISKLNDKLGNSTLEKDESVDNISFANIKNYEKVRATIINPDSSLQMTPTKNVSLSPNRRLSNFQQSNDQPDKVHKSLVKSITMAPIDNNRKSMSSRGFNSSEFSNSQQVNNASNNNYNNNNSNKNINNSFKNNSIEKSSSKQLNTRKTMNISSSSRLTFDKFEADFTNIWQNSLKIFTNQSDSFETTSLKSSISGNWRILIKILKMSYGIHLGVCKTKIGLSELTKRQFLGKNPSEYALNLFSGYLWMNDKKYQKIERTFKVGDIVEMSFENGALVFRCGNETIPAFKGVPENMYPAATIMNKGDSLEIINVETL